MLLCMVGFENNIAQIIIIERQCIAIKNHITWLKVEVTVGSSTLCIGLNETCSCPANNFVVCSGILKDKLAQMVIMIRPFC